MVDYADPAAWRTVQRRVRAEDARQRGFAAVTIRADTRAAGLIPNAFPAGEVLVAMSGPPGGVSSIVVANVKTPAAELPDIIRASLGGWLGNTIEVGAADHAQIAGEDRGGSIFYTGAGFGRVGWFGCVVARLAGSVLVAIGVSARSAKPIAAPEFLANRAIAPRLPRSRSFERRASSARGESEAPVLQPRPSRRNVTT